MKIAIVAAGFSPSEADGLRRAMATFRKVGTISTFQTKMVEGMVANGYERAFAERCFKQLEGFGEYGFPESHAASFALLVYASCWMKCHYPDVFAAALLNAQPLGFYAPAQIVRDAREHGVEVRPPDVNGSDWDATLEGGATCPPHKGGGNPPRLHPRHASMADDIWTRHAIRLGLREIKGFREEAGRLITARRGKGYDSVRDLWLRTGLEVSLLERLADADAFGSLGLTRRDALWAVKALGRTGDASQDLPLFARPPGPASEPDVALPPMPPGEEVVNDYRFLKMSLKAHPVDFVRTALDARRVTRNEALPVTAPGRRIAVAGLVLVRQRPGSAKGVLFMTIEDEGGIANVIVWPKVFEKFRPVVLAARFVIVHGRLQSEHGVIHVVADSIEDCTGMLDALCADNLCADNLCAEPHADTRAVSSLAPADEVKRPQFDARDKRIEAEAKKQERRVMANLGAGLEPASSARVHGQPSGRHGPYPPRSPDLLGDVLPRGRRG